MFITQMRFLFIYIFTYIYSYTYIYFFIFIHLAGILILWYFQGISGFSLHVKWEPVPRNRAITFRFLFFQKDDLAQIYPEKKKGHYGPNLVRLYWLQAQTLPTWAASGSFRPCHKGC